MPIDLDRLRAALADRYRVERELGRGGMATVFLAEDLKHRRQVAVKVLEPELASHLGAGRFLREIETAARLNHPHILPLYDSDEADGFLYYVMPYMSGDSLRDQLNRERQLSVEEAVHLAREIADGLDYAHEQGVVHRDIKPGNIMLSRGHAVIADFGIARAVAEAGGERVTKTGVSLGSPTYMSPEQAAGREAIDGRADVYALGCVLYEMLAGEAPFSGGTSAALMARKQLESAPRLASVRETVPPELDRVVATALSSVPADRYRTAGEFSRALGEVPGVGSGSETTGPTASRPEFGGSPRGVRRWVIGGAAVALALVAGWLLFDRGGRTGATADGPAPVTPATGGPGAGAASAAFPASSPDPRSIAVIPFANSSAEGEDAAFFADGIHDELLTQLSKIGSLKVISRTSVMQYAGTTKTIPQIGAELGVATVLEGGVQRAGDRVRVTVQLIDARDDSHLWAETYNRELTAASVFAIQSEIAEKVARQLEATLTPGEQARLRAQPTDNIEAYELYLRAVQILTRYEQEDAREAVDYLKAAIDIDPNFARAYARLASAYFSLGVFDQMPWKEAQAQALAAAQKALDLDPTIGEAHLSLALVLEQADEIDRAEAEYRRAIELTPGLPGAHEAYGDLLLQSRGRPDEALQEFLRAHELDPTSLRISWGVGQAYYMSRDYDGAIEFLRRTLAEKPEHPFATSFMLRGLASALVEKGMVEDAIEVDRERAERLGDGTPVCLDVCVIALARSGRQPEARRRLEDLIAWVDASDREANLPNPRRPERIARVYVALGEPDLAFEWLERDYEEYQLNFSYLKLDPQWDPLRVDPRFDALLRKAGLAE